MTITEDMERDAAQKAVQRAQEAAAEFLRKRYEEDLRAELATPAGRRLLFSLMRDNLFFAAIGPGAGMEFRLGMRAAAQRLRTQIEAIDPQLPAMMEREWLMADDKRSVGDAAAAAT